MRRRALLTTVAAASLAGCPSGGGERSTDSPQPPTAAPPVGSPTSGAGWTPVRRTATGVTATFRVVDVHPPTTTPRPVTASFEGRRVVVTGAMDPAGCREPVLRSVAYDASARRVRLVVGTESPWGPSPTVVCHDPVYDYRCDATVAGGTPAAVEVVHSLHGREDRTVVVEAE